MIYALNNYSFLIYETEQLGHQGVTLVQLDVPIGQEVFPLLVYLEE